MAHHITIKQTSTSLVSFISRFSESELIQVGMCVCVCVCVCASMHAYVWVCVCLSTTITLCNQFNGSD